jgi:NADH-quinone oxidoreductase subunit L
MFVKPLVDGSRAILWHGIDQGVIDAAVDSSADGARDASDTLRRMQSGNVRSYAGWVTIGAAAVIAYMIWVALR